ncbi:MAG: Radical SAM superfamily enzyme [Candidatus Methanohalarchaeum thermophilum]|uniref:Radical SAM superfamily enzyme n=1 Tax=Methanohalarchaeum thermophilum TaxID=1903181 RepID=A0A1Q6DUL7_METT1|nr:MAG: Radical SAM superfamily enzyme [Candidatus Methanohalarchaeum thermophilum]
MKVNVLNSKLLKVDLDYNGEKELELETSGLLSPFFKGRISEIEEYLKELSPVVSGQKLFLSTGFPPVPSNGFQRMVKNEIKRLLGFHKPNDMTIMVTNECQCNCKHCLANDLMNQNEELTNKEIKNLIDQGIELGVSQIVFEGGEPTLRDDLPDLVGYVGDRASTMVVTNGYEIKESYIDELDKNGLGCINFSLDSPYPEKHNEFRRKENLFSSVIESIEASVSSNILTGILYVANPFNSNKSTIKDLIELGRQLGVFEIMIEEIVDVGNWENRENLTERDKKDIRALKYEQNAGIVTNFFELRDKFGCFAGDRWFYVSPSGEVMPCMHAPISYGNFKEKPLSEIWKRIRRDRWIKDTGEECLYEKDYYKKSIKELSKSNKLPYKIKDLKK